MQKNALLTNLVDVAEKSNLGLKTIYALVSTLRKELYSLREQEKQWFDRIWSEIFELDEVVAIARDAQRDEFSADELKEVETLVKSIRELLRSKIEN